MRICLARSSAPMGGNRLCAVWNTTKNLHRACILVVQRTTRCNSLRGIIRRGGVLSCEFDRSWPVLKPLSCRLSPGRDPRCISRNERCAPSAHRHGRRPPWLAQYVLHTPWRRLMDDFAATPRNTNIHVGPSWLQAISPQCGRRVSESCSAFRHRGWPCSSSIPFREHVLRFCMLRLVRRSRPYHPPSAETAGDLSRLTIPPARLVGFHVRRVEDVNLRWFACGDPRSRGGRR